MCNGNRVQLVIEFGLIGRFSAWLPSREIFGKIRHRMENAQCDKSGIITRPQAGGLP